MSDNIHVALRVRPLNQREINNDQGTCWEVTENAITYQSGGRGGPSTFTFDRVFGTNSTNAEVYEWVARDIVLSTVDGVNGTIFAYGQTSSGKTYTMKGGAGNPGVMELAVKEIFTTMAAVPDRKFTLRVSYMEIYNEKITDLLNPRAKDLSVRESLERGIFVDNLTEIVAETPEEVLKHMETGEANRHIGETNMNERSSRSHTVFRTVIESRMADSHSMDTDDDSFKVACLTLVDLAGSERISQTKAEGVRLKEGQHINRSLLALSTVISKLSSGRDGHIPYRDATLTRILQPSLGGNARTAIICTITPATIHYEDSLGTLNFSARAKRVTNRPTVNKVVSKDALLKQAQRDIYELEGRLAQREKEIAHLRVELKQKAHPHIPNEDSSSQKENVPPTPIAMDPDVDEPSVTDLPYSESPSLLRSAKGFGTLEQTPSTNQRGSRPSPKSTPLHDSQSLETCLQAAQSETADLRSQLAACQSAYESLREECTRIQSLAESSESRAARLEVEWVEWRERVERMEGEHGAHVQRMREEADARVDEYVCQVVDLTAQVQVLHQSNSMLEQQLNQANHDRDNLRNEILAVTSRMESAENARMQLTSQIETVLAQGEESKREISDLMAKIDQLQTEIETERARSEQSCSEIADAYRQLDQLREENAVSLGNFARSQVDLQDTKECLSQSEAECEELKRQIDQSRAECQGAYERLAQLESDHRRISDEIGRLSNEKAEMDSRLQDSSMEIRKLGLELETADNRHADEIGKLVQRCDFLEGECKAKELQIAELVKEIKDKTDCEEQTKVRHMEEYERKIEGMQTEISQLQNMLKGLEEKANECEQRAERAERDMGNIVGALERIVKGLEGMEGLEDRNISDGGVDGFLKLLGRRLGEVRDECERWKEEAQRVGVEVTNLYEWQKGAMQAVRRLMEGLCWSTDTADGSLLEISAVDEVINGAVSAMKSLRENLKAMSERECTVCTTLEQTLTQQQQQHQSDLSSLRQQLAGAQAQRDAAQTKMAHLESQLEDARMDLVEIVHRLQQLEGLVQEEQECAVCVQLREQLAALTSAHSQASAHIESLETRLVEVQKHLEEERRQLANLQSSLSQSSQSRKQCEKCEATQAQVTDLEARLTQAEDDKTSINAAYCILQNEHADLQETNSSTQEKLCHLERQHTCVQKQLTSIQKTYEELQSKQSSLESEKTEMKNQCRNLETEIKETRERNEGLQAQANENETERWKLVQELEQGNAKIKKMTKELEEARKEMSTIAEVAEGHRRRLGDLQKEVERLEGERASLQAQLERFRAHQEQGGREQALEAELSELRSQHEHSNQQAYEYFSQLQATIDDLNAQLAQLQSQTVHLRAQHDMEQQVRQQVEGQLAQAQAKYTSMQHTVENIRQQSNMLPIVQAELKAALARVDEKEATLKSHEQQLRRLQKSVTEFSAHVCPTDTNSSAYAREIDHLSSQVSQHKQEAERYRQQAETLQQQVKGMRGEIDAANQSAARARKDVDVFRSDANILIDARKKAEETVSQLRTELEELKKEAPKLTARCQVLEEEMKIVVRSRDTLKEEIEQKNAEIEKLAQSFSRAQEQARRAEETMQQHKTDTDQLRARLATATREAAGVVGVRMELEQTKTLLKVTRTKLQATEVALKFAQEKGAAKEEETGNLEEEGSRPLKRKRETPAKPPAHHDVPKLADENSSSATPVKEAKRKRGEGVTPFENITNMNTRERWAGLAGGAQGGANKKDAKVFPSFKAFNNKAGEEENQPLSLKPGGVLNGPSPFANIGSLGQPTTRNGDSIFGNRALTSQPLLAQIGQSGASKVQQGTFRFKGSEIGAQSVFGDCDRVNAGSGAIGKSNWLFADGALGDQTKRTEGLGVSVARGRLTKKLE